MAGTTLAAISNQHCGVQPKSSRTALYLLPLDSCEWIDINSSSADWNHHVDPEVLTGIQFPLPPLPEQRRIVAKLEKLLDKVDACQQRLAKIPIILKRFRQSVLAAACSGRLTADWRQERAIELEGWTEAVLKDVAEMRLGKMLDNAKNIGNPTRYLRNLNVRWFSFDLSDIATMRATSEERNELEIKDGDLLVCEGGEPGLLWYLEFWSL